MLRLERKREDEEERTRTVEVWVYVQVSGKFGIGASIPVNAKVEQGIVQYCTKTLTSK